MDQVLTTFIRALRNANVRISTSETLDAFRTVQLIGYGNRTRLKQALSLVLPKTLDEKRYFDVTFDQFFARRDLRRIDEIAGGGDADLAQAGNHNDSGSGSAGDGADSSPGLRGNESQVAQLSDGPSSPLPHSARKGEGESASQSEPSALGQLLMRSDTMEIHTAINSAGQAVRIHEIEVFTQKGVYTRRIMDTMGQAELQQEISSLNHGADASELRRAAELTRRREWLREAVRGYVDQQFLLHADVTGRRLREDMLRNVRLSSINVRHQRLLQEAVRRMARRLVAAHSRRRKVFRRGQLHLPGTLRHNMKYDDALFDLKWKASKVARPRVFAICDVSGSVADYASFMLMFLYSLDEVLPKVRSFAFSSNLGEVSELFRHNQIHEAMALTLKQFGNGSTDYGEALADFCRLCLDDIDNKTTLIVLGDARNNFGDSRLDLMKLLHDRCRRLIWLNPEPRSMWNTGDSEMRHFRSYCHQVDECSTLAQLERFVGRLLKSV